MNETIRVTAKPTARIGLQVKAAKVKVSPGNSGNMPIIIETYEKYDGEYEVIPTFEGQVLETKDKVMQNNVTVTEIPVFETSNTAGGTTVYIGKEIEIHGK